MRPFRPNPAPAHGTASRELFRIPLGRRQLILRQTRIAPGGGSGPHYHDGILFVLVTRGVLDHPGLDGPAVYRRGRIFREPSGPEHAHIARNTGTGTTAILVCYWQPAGSPLSRSTRLPPDI